MRERDIFIEALEHDDPSSRAAILDNACQNDAELRSRVERLLAEHERQESFILDIPPSALNVTVDQSIAERPGSVIGPYKLLQQIGEGGMGVVFMAQQTSPLERTVALKIIKPGMDTKQVVARFEAERQALAMMNHPSIAKVLDAGSTVSGRPYFVMELVKGVSITKYCDENCLPLRDRLTIFVQVCLAMQHAHQKGVIHRDLKPNNVLVAEYDHAPVPKVIDFGVAKATEKRLTERTMFTEFGEVLGTMEYMSPEQSKLNQLDIDTRSDIYSLGVLLYELLVGSTPLEGKRLHEAAFDEMLRIIREEEPPKPSTRVSSSEALPAIAAMRNTEPARLGKDMRGELDWIAMKALDKDRNRRYETASGFAADVQRYLDKEAVLACPPSSGYRLRKFAQRNRGPVVAATLVFLTLLTGVLGTTTALIHVQASRRMADAREAETRAILQFVEKRVFAAAGPEGDDGGLGRDVTLRDAVESALPFVQLGFSGRPEIEARLRMTLGTAFLNLGEANKAAEQFEKSRKLRSKYLGPKHPDTLESMNNLASAYADLGQYADALSLNEETLSMRKSVLGPDHPDTLKCMANLSYRYHQLGRYDEALALSEETMPLMRATFDPDDPATLGQMVCLGVAYASVGRLDDAIRIKEETLSLMKANPDLDSRYVLAAMNNLANSLAENDRYDDALQLRKDVLAIRKAKLGPDHLLTLRSMDNLASSYILLCRYSEALSILEESLALARAKLGRDHPAALGMMGNLARTYHSMNRHEDALRVYQEALVPSRAKLGVDHPKTLMLMWGLSIELVKLDRNAEAAPIIEDCLRLAEGKQVHPDLVPGVTMLRIRNFQETSDVAGCRATAEMYEQLTLTKPSSIYDAACLRAIVAAVLESDKQTPPTELARHVAAETDRAMALLKQAVAAGFKDVRHIQQDEDLIALRDREDFRALIADLQIKAIEP